MTCLRLNNKVSISLYSRSNVKTVFFDPIPDLCVLQHNKEF